MTTDQICVCGHYLGIHEPRGDGSLWCCGYSCHCEQYRRAVLTAMTDLKVGDKVGALHGETHEVPAIDGPAPGSEVMSIDWHDGRGWVRYSTTDMFRVEVEGMSQDELIKVWSCGHNLAGYLPEADVALFDDADAAKQYQIDEMRNIADLIDPSFEDEEEQYATALTHLAEDLNLSSVDNGWGDVVDYRSGSQAWWINVEMMTRAEYNAAVEEMGS